MKKWLSLAFMLSIFICMLDTTILNIALPAISENLGVSLDQLSWALNAYTIAFASLTIPITRFAELFGQKRFFIAGALIFGIGSIVSGMAGQLSILILGRIIQSVGAATIFPLAMVLGINQVDSQRRTKMIALLGLMQGLPAALGPSLGGIITQWLNWHWLFFINVPLVVLIVVIAAKALAKQPRVTDLHLDLTGSFLSIITLASLTTMLVQGRTWGWQSWPTLGFASLSIIAFGLFLYCERHQPDPMIPLNLFKNRQFVGAAIVIVLSSFFLVATTVILPNYYVNVMGQTTFEASLMITPITAMIFFLSPVSGFSLEKLGPRTLLATGFILMLLGYYGYGFTNALSHSGSAMIAGALIGAGYGLIVGPTTVLAAANFTGTLLSASQSVAGVLRQIGVVISVAVFVSLLTANVSTAKNNVSRHVQEAVKQSDLPQPVQDQVLPKLQHQLTGGNQQKQTQDQSAVAFPPLTRWLQNNIGDLIAYSKTRYRLAYVRLYRYATPALGLSLFSVILFKKRPQSNHQ